MTEELVCPGLRGCSQPLSTAYDVALLDLDGVVYVGLAAVPAAPAAVRAARAAGMRVAFVTNNASRSPATVAAHLVELGVEADPDDVVTAAQAAARVLRERLGPGRAVLVVGTDALAAEVVGAGLRVVASAADGPDGVVQGHSPTTRYDDLAEAMLALSAGAVWVASNTDLTIPSPRGRLPGNGALVAALAAATGRTPEVAGKPLPALHHAAVERTGARRPLVVGDRLDTDVEGAHRTGSDSLLVLSGVTGPAELLAAGPVLRPTYLGADLSALSTPHPGVVVERRGEPSSARCRGSVVTLDPAGPTVERADVGGDRLDTLRAGCALAWAAADAGRPLDLERLAGALSD